MCVRSIGHGGGSDRARRVKEIIAEKAQKKQQAKEAVEAAMSKARMPPPPPPSSSSSSSPQPPPRPRSPLLQQQHDPQDAHHPPAGLGSGLSQDGDRCGNMSLYFVPFSSEESTDLKTIGRRILCQDRLGTHVSELEGRAFRAAAVGDCMESKDQVRETNKRRRLRCQFTSETTIVPLPRQARDTKQNTVS